VTSRSSMNAKRISKEGQIAAQRRQPLQISKMRFSSYARSAGSQKVSEAGSKTYSLMPPSPCSDMEHPQK